MTALKKYQKLESGGLWRPTAHEQRREVVVNLGDTSLVLSDPRKEMALAHWSLPAVLRRNPGAMPAVFSPGLGDDETLEIDDPDMIAALETVHDALEAARPHPGRLRNAILGGILAGVIGLGWFWLPDALVHRTAAVLPEATRAEIGKAVLEDLARLTGQPCHAWRGAQALEQLGTRLFGADAPLHLLIVREGVRGAITLPGRQIVLGEPLLAKQDGPELAAGFAMAQAIRIETTDPVIPFLRHAGLRATLQLLTTGVLPEGAVAGYGQVVLSQSPSRIPDALLLERFEAAGITTTPYADALDPTGNSTTALKEADPFATAAPPALLPDEAWVSLQDICTS